MSTQFNKILTKSTAFISVSLILLGFLSFSSPTIFAVGNNNSNLVVGTTETSTTVTVSLCLNSDDTTLHLTDATNWLKYDPAGLTPDSTIVNSGVFSNTTSYSPLKWVPVANTTDVWSVQVTYTGGTGSQLNPTSDYVGIVKFNKTGSGTKTVDITKNLYFSTEEADVPMNITRTNVTGDCKGTVTPPTYTLGSYAGPLTGVAGSAFPSLTTTGCNLAAASNNVTIGITGTTINGTMSYPGCVFTPNSGSIIPAAFVGQNPLVLSMTGLTSLNIPANITAAVITPTRTLGTYTGPLTGVAGSTFPTLTTTGCNLAAASNNVTIGITGTTINGTMSFPGCVFTPNSGSIIPAAFVGQNPLVLSMTGLTSLNIPARITASTATTSSSTVSSSISSTTAPASTGGGTIFITNKPTLTKPSITDPLDCTQKITGNAIGESVKISLEFYDSNGKLAYLFQDIPKSATGDYLFQINSSDPKSASYVAPGDYKIKYIATDKNNQTASGEYQATIKANAECQKVAVSSSSSSQAPAVPKEDTTTTLPKTGGNTNTANQTPQQQAQQAIINSGVTPRTGGLENLVIALVIFIIPVSVVSFLAFKRKEIPFFKTKK